MPTFQTEDGVALRYDVRGHGPPVYVCHGGPNNTCDTLLAELEPLQDRSTLVFHDYRGSGSSQTAPAETYRFERLADDLDELRTHLGHESIGVLAHSMGGLVALHYALRHPAGCRRLALVATTPGGPAGAMVWPALRALGPLRTVRALGLGLRFLLLWSWRDPSPVRTRAMFAPMAVTQEPRRELRDLVDAAHRGLPVDTDNSAHLLAAMRRLDLRHDLHAIRCPTLVMYGSRDAVMVAGGQLLAAGLPDPEVHVLPDVGHELFLEDPARTFDALERFLHE